MLPLAGREREVNQAAQGPLPKPDCEAELRADERSRIAREVHDSTSQLLVVMQLELGRLRRAAPPDADPMIDECQHVLDEMRKAIRALRLD